jgi:heat shock protein HslJ
MGAISALQGSWVVERLAIGGELHDPIDGPDLTLEIDGQGRVAGSAGVNRFMGRVVGEGSFGPLATTLMAGPEELMVQERVYLQLLSEVESVEETPEGISLVGGGLILLTLEPADREPASGAKDETS